MAASWNQSIVLGVVGNPGCVVAEATLQDEYIVATVAESNAELNQGSWTDTFVGLLGALGPPALTMWHYVTMFRFPYSTIAAKVRRGSAQITLRC